MTRTAKAAMISMVAVVSASVLPAFSQCNLGGAPQTTLHDPLIDGAFSTAPMQAAPDGQPPPVGDGATPAPVTPGMPGGPSILPSVPMTPADQIEYGSYRVNWDPTNESPPGVIGPGTWAPPPPSTPGSDPGIIHAPLDFHAPPALVVNINPNGGIPGYPPSQRWGGQQTHDFGRYKHRGKQTDDFGQQENGSNSQDGANHARAGAVDTQDRFGNRFPLRNNGDQIVQTIAPW